MTDTDLSRHLQGVVRGALEGTGLTPEQLEPLAAQLVWRVGRTSDDSPVTVRVGYASSARHFAELPKLKNATDQELETALSQGEIRVEWVGTR